MAWHNFIDVLSRIFVMIMAPITKLTKKKKVFCGQKNVKKLGS
jgi:hypothetical protein